MKKALLTIGIIVITLVIAYIAKDWYYVSRIGDVGEGWKVCHNRNVGITVKIPEDNECRYEKKLLNFGVENMAYRKLTPEEDFVFSRIMTQPSVTINFFAAIPLDFDSEQFKSALKNGYYKRSNGDSVFIQPFKLFQKELYLAILIDAETVQPARAEVHLPVKDERYLFIFNPKSHYATFNLNYIKQKYPDFPNMNTDQQIELLQKLAREYIVAINDF